MSDEAVSAPTSPEEDVGDIKASIAQQTPTQPSQIKRRKKKVRKNASSLPGNSQILATRSEIVATGEQGTTTIEQLLVQSDDTHASQIQRKRREKKKRHKDRKKEGEMKEGPDDAEGKDEEDDSSSFDSVENGNDVDQEDEERNTPTAKESRGRNRFTTLFKDTSELTRARRKRCVSSGSLADGASGGWGMGGFVESTNKALLLPMRKISIPKLRSLYKYTTLGLTTELLLGTRSSESETSDSSDDEEDDLENTPPNPPNATNGQKRASGDPPLDFLEVHADISESWLNILKFVC